MSDDVLVRVPSGLIERVRSTERRRCTGCYQVDPCDACEARASASRALADAILAADPVDLDALLAKAKARADGMREGLHIAEEHAEISEHDGWHKHDPRIDWDDARAAVEAACAKGGG